MLLLQPSMLPQLLLSTRLATKSTPRSTTSPRSLSRSTPPPTPPSRLSSTTGTSCITLLFLTLKLVTLTQKLVTPFSEKHVTSFKLFKSLKLKLRDDIDERERNKSAYEIYS